MRHIIYHANCPDGFGAAYAAWKRFGEGATYTPMQYGDTLPEVGAGAEVWFLDFCLSPEAMEPLREQVAKIEIRDHHKSARDDWGLNGSPAAIVGPKLGALFDMDKSGAVLAWEHFHPDTPVPALLRYVQDRDLWRFELPWSRAFSAYLSAEPYDFESWDHIAAAIENTQKLMEAVRMGEMLLKLKEQKVAEMADRCRWEYVGGHRVPVANATCFFSEVGEELCLRNPDAPFSAYYFDMANGLRKWGLRSRGGFDVSEVAKALGGGGHPAAAGFETAIPKDGS